MRITERLIISILLAVLKELGVDLSVSGRDSLEKIFHIVVELANKILGKDKATAMLAASSPAKHVETQSESEAKTEAAPETAPAETVVEASETADEATQG